MGYSADQAAPAVTWKLITPHDSAASAATPGCRGIYVGGAGNVALVGQDNVAVTFTAIPVGTFMPCAAKRVNATNTTATLIIALF
jgi:hypothetical protein